MASSKLLAMLQEALSLKKQLQKLPNIGPAMAQDLIKLGIRSIDELKDQNPDEMYTRLCELTGQRQDPCVLDTFRAVVHNAKTGDSKKWWEFTPLRKA